MPSEAALSGLLKLLSLLLRCEDGLGDEFKALGWLRGLGEGLCCGMVGLDAAVGEGEWNDAPTPTWPAGAACVVPFCGWMSCEAEPLLLRR